MRGSVAAAACVLAVAAGVALIAWPRAARVDVPTIEHASTIDEPTTSTHAMPLAHRHRMHAPSDVASDIASDGGDDAALDVAVDEVAPSMSPAPGIDPRIDPHVPSRSQFAGSRDKQRISIEEQLLLESSVAHFKTGWEALRAARFEDAIAAFDRAADPSVAEDAAFWAAVAAQRAHRADARQRFETFVARFPESPRAESARRALGSMDVLH